MTDHTPADRGNQGSAANGYVCDDADAAYPLEQLHGPLAETPDDVIHDYGHPDDEQAEAAWVDEYLRCGRGE